METLQIPNSMKEILQFAEGKTIQEKLARLLLSDLENRLRSCTERLYEFEKKYGLEFKEFKEAWEKDKVPEKFSYEIERDYMEWESLEDEHDLLLSKLREMKERLSL
ncbi:unnamed protein product [marine sediment metagenome]|uniref:Uncharacterized protein n=1 Tax=marine sediment metagenome TaxID=412755 RepID=X1BQY9_9ZZZZ